MRFKINVIILILSAIFLTQQIRAENLRFINGFWFDGKTFQAKTVYSLNGILSFNYKGKIDSTVDLQNNYVIPPFAEAHTHQFLDVMNFQEQIGDYLIKGIFYVKNLNSLPRFTIRVRPFINQPKSVDVVYANGGLTATGGHPIQIYTSLAQNGVLSGLTAKDVENEAFFIIDDEKDLAEKWQIIKSQKPDFIKTYLDHSEEYELRKNDEKYYGKKGLNPQLLPKIVARAHQDNLRVSVHITTSQDFHNAVIAGVDEIAHLPLEKINEADAKLAAQKKIFVVTTTLSHRDTSGIQNLDEFHRDNLKLLYKSGVKIAIGTDNMPTAAIEEAENIYRLKVFDNLTLLKIWTEITPQTIFPNRKIGFLKNGYEASFLALQGNPIEDFSNIRKINFRYKQGQLINRGQTK
ncbi:MAG: amidohydrolase family protein [Pyrinomonadaceae bacterium]|nr:amidohydrolase family protein [Pyrinomonadaceae bacterium]